MLEPIIGFSLIFLTIALIIKLSNNKRETLYKSIIESLKDETELYVEQTKCSTITSGLKNRDLLFNYCDLYVTKRALIILGFTKGSHFKQLSKPIILTSEINEYSRRFPFAHVKRINDISFENNIAKINYGDKGITQTEVVLKLKSLKEVEIAKIKEVAEKNFWKISAV